MFDSFNQRKDIVIQGNMSFIQKFRPRKYILDSSVFMHSCQTTGLSSSVCVVDCAIDGFIGDQISFSKGDALVSKNRVK